jgi:hypothetical protein
VRWYRERVDLEGIMSVTLYGLAGADEDRRFSLFCWRTRMALAHIAVEALHVHDHLHEKDKAYFRTSREARFGMTLEAFCVDRDAKLAAFRQSLTPLRATLQAQPYLGAEAPDYADYIVFGGFQWARCTSTLQLLAADDPIAAWRRRLLDAFDGLAGKAKGYPC